MKWKKLSKEQRADSYRLAAELVFAHGLSNDHCVGCWALAKVSNINVEVEKNSLLYHEYERTGMRIIFPEFALFIPDGQNYGMGSFWDLFDYESRTLGLLFAEQIALHP